MSDRHLMGRRQFLAVSSTCAVAAATMGPKLFAAASPAPQRLAVGFAPLTENAAVMAASHIPASDGGFIGRGARITVSGASGAPAEPRARRGVELLAHFSYLDGAQRRTAPFLAWSGSRLTGCQGNSVGFNVPVDDVQNVKFTVGAERGAPRGVTSRRGAFVGGVTESSALPLTLSLQEEQSSLRLSRGYYVVVPVFDGDAEPSWRGWTVQIVDGRRSLADAEGNVAPFEHFVLKVDYATL